MEYLNKVPAAYCAIGSIQQRDTEKINNSLTILATTSYTIPYKEMRAQNV